MRLSTAARLGVMTLFLSSPVLAQDAGTGTPAAPPDRERTIFDGDYITLGAGAGYGPSYEGSDDYIVFPAAAVQGSVRGIDINARAAGLALDFINDGDDARISYSLGPVVKVRTDRTSRIEDPVVSLLGELSTAVELGVAAGVTLNRPLTGYDTLTANVDVSYDVAGAHGGTIVYPSLTYLTPVSRGAAVVLSIGAEHVSRDYADYYYSVTPAGSLASGLPVFQADGGWKNIGVTAAGVIDLNGDLADGGVALYFGGGYYRLLEDTKRSPIVSIRGAAGQFIGAIGLGYTF